MIDETNDEISDENDLEDELEDELESEIDFENFRLKPDQKMYCLKCGNPAAYERHGYAWCEEHKDYLKQDPEELEIIVIKRLEDLGL